VLWLILKTATNEKDNLHIDNCNFDCLPDK